ncbi:MAG: acylphosphatase [Candidatus Kerfeldbacteria bacterium]|nr:acylphosphatase [Candidatus Kerfeldbacteria bacterium]
MRIVLIVHGTVQGVNFRSTAQSHAQQEGLRGTVENRPDGTVRVFLEGSAASIERFRANLRTNPGNARIERVEETSPTPRDRTPDGFRILR